LSGRGLCEELITRPEESYRLYCVVVCDLETSRIGAPYIYDISYLRVDVSEGFLTIHELIKSLCLTQFNLFLFYNTTHPHTYTHTHTHKIPISFL
jgi:hypothetical protein